LPVPVHHAAGGPAPDSGDRATFDTARLRWGECREAGHAEILALHRDLLALRRNDPTFAGHGTRRVDGAVLGEGAFVLRFFGSDAPDRLLVLNLGRRLHLDPVTEPLLAPPSGSQWHLLWSSEDPRYGGLGARPPERVDGWELPSESGLVLIPAPNTT
jgi:maltooligosyltrehalose trehalohydrolase